MQSYKKYTGEYAAFEIKLGTGQIDVAAANLTKFAAVIDTTKTQAPQSLNILARLLLPFSAKQDIRQPADRPAPEEVPCGAGF